MAATTFWGVAFAGVDLTADFAGVFLTGTTLGVALDGVDFSGAALIGVVFTGVTLATSPMDLIFAAEALAFGVLLMTALVGVDFPAANETAAATGFFRASSLKELCAKPMGSFTLFLLWGDTTAINFFGGSDNLFFGLFMVSQTRSVNYSSSRNPVRNKKK